MKVWEIVLTFAVGIVFGALCFGVMAFASNASFHAFGFETFINIGKFLR
jgi:hypothetical protein